MEGRADKSAEECGRQETEDVILFGRKSGFIWWSCGFLKKKNYQNFNVRRCASARSEHQHQAGVGSKSVVDQYPGCEGRF
jgi:hypothetical protein